MTAGKALGKLGIPRTIIAPAVTRPRSSGAAWSRHVIDSNPDGRGATGRQRGCSQSIMKVVTKLEPRYAVDFRVARVTSRCVLTESSGTGSSCDQIALTVAVSQIPIAVTSCRKEFRGSAASMLWIASTAAEGCGAFTLDEVDKTIGRTGRRGRTRRRCDSRRTANFQKVNCARCGGMLGPDIVYFGENALEDCAAASFELVDATDTLLMAGSSLMLRPARVSRRFSRSGRRSAALSGPRSQMSCCRGR
jgi:hypothetical protein